MISHPELRQVVRDLFGGRRTALVHPVFENTGVLDFLITLQKGLAADYVPAILEGYSRDRLRRRDEIRLWLAESIALRARHLNGVLEPTRRRVVVTCLALRLGYNFNPVRDSLTPEFTSPVLAVRITPSGLVAIRSNRDATSGALTLEPAPAPLHPNQSYGEGELTKYLTEYLSNGPRIPVEDYRDNYRRPPAIIIGGVPYRPAQEFDRMIAGVGTNQPLWVRWVSSP